MAGPCASFTSRGSLPLKLVRNGSEEKGFWMMRSSRGFDKRTDHTDRSNVQPLHSANTVSMSANAPIWIACTFESSCTGFKRKVTVWSDSRDACARPLSSLLAQPQSFDSGWYGY